MSTLGNDPADFDHGSETFMRDPYPAYADYCANCPVVHTDKYGGFAFATTYGPVKQLFQDFRRFTSTHGGSLPSQPIIMYPIDLDPPEHTAYRLILNPAFTIEAIAAKAPMVQAIVDGLIDGFIRDGEADLAAQLARPLLPAVILPMIGVPMEDEAYVREQVDVLVRRHKFSEDQIQEAFLNVRDYLLQLAASRRNDTGPARDDILGLLLRSSIAGEGLTDDQIFRTLSIILAGGLDTTTSAMLEAFLFLARNPEEKARLMAESDWSLAIEEFVRFSSPVQGIKRVVLEDTELAGCTLKAGERVFAVLGSANRDPEVFERLEECDLARHPNRHLAFGSGAHTCLGRHLAKLEMRTAIRAVLERLPDFTVPDGFEPEYVTGETRGIKSLPVNFTPGAMPSGDGVRRRPTHQKANDDGD